MENSNGGGVGNGNAFNCTREHYNIIKQAYYRGIESVLVFEDDFIFNDVEKTIKMFSQKLPDDWKLIQYAYSNGTKEEFDEPVLDFFELVPITEENHHWSTSCYALSRAGMKYYIDYMSKEYSVADYPLYESYKYISGCYCTNENICGFNENLKTTIQEE